MKSITGQSGITIGLSGVTTFSATGSLKLTNPDDNSYIEFLNSETLTTVSIGVSDIDNNGSAGAIYLDVGTVNNNSSPIYGKTLISILASDLDHFTTMDIESFNYNGTALGSLYADNICLSEFDLFIGAHNCGLDMEFGFKLDIDTFSYKYSNLNTLTFSGIHFAQTLTGDTANSSTWQTDGKFTIGDIFRNNPATFDVGEVSGQASIVLDMPLKGSMAIESMNFGDRDFGPLVAKGVNLSMLKVEIPGRGLGR